MKERLDKFLSKVGVCSRSDVPSFIRSGQIFVNGEKAFDKAQKIETETDEILFCGEKVFAKENVYIMMNKTQNYVSSNKEGIYESVFSLLPSEYRTPNYEEKLHIVGRLDVDTEGFL
ncbi:MAG: rRNA pseudouridine synthase, partial [Treponema sp.]|nr:rRNA pseudouridine synthase [Treponema sp.]